MKVTKFKNGHFSVKADKKNRNLLEDLINNVELDFLLLGEPRLTGNGTDVSHALYNAHTDSLYLIIQSEIDEYNKGKRVKLIAFHMSKADREELEKQLSF